MSELSLDDATAEALLRGEPADGEPELVAVAAFVRDMRATTTLPAPAPSPARAAVLRDGLDGAGPWTGPAPASHGRRPLSLGGWRRRLAVAGIGLGVAVTGVVGAGAAGLLPAPVERVIGDVVEALTPLELPAGGKDVGRSTGDPAPAGDRPGGTAPGTPGSDPRPSVSPPAPGGPGSQSGSAPAGTGGPGATAPAGAGTPTPQAPSAGSPPGVTAPPITSPTPPAVGTLPSASTTVPSLPTVPAPTIPGVTVPGAPSTAVPNRQPTLPRLPW